MNILLVGPGSIGKRHLKNILQFGYEDIAIVSRSAVLDKAFSSLKNYKTIDEAAATNYFDSAIICTPSSQHISDLQKLLEHNIQNIYVEKPVSYNYNNINIIQKKAEETKSKIIIGYDLHFEPGLQKVKELIQNNTVGKIISVNAVVGQYLPGWRPQHDYTKSMSALTNKGGGVMLDLIHEFDYLYWLMGNVKRIAAQYINSKSLDIETEDAAEILLQFDSGAIGTIHLDYLQPKLVRNCMLTGSNGTIFWDATLNEVRWVDRNKCEHNYSYYGFERNDRFKQIIQIFLEEKEDMRLTTLNEGLVSLKLVLAAKHSSEQQKFIQINQFNP